MKRGTVKTRFRFIARHARAKLRRAFARWTLYARSTAFDLAFAPKPVLSQESMTLLGLLKLENLTITSR